MFHWLYASTIFLSAFLGFFIQPLLAKHLLPIFGSSAFVWMASILFFQIGLLLGYGYAYLLVKFCSDKMQAIIHCGIIILSFLFISPHSQMSMSDIWPPLAVMWLLACYVFLPFIVISASSPLLQHWFCQIRFADYPYYLYAISNAGSLIGLLGYPILLEPIVGIRNQIYIWSGLYSLYAILCFLCLRKLLLSEKLKNKKKENKNCVTSWQITQWIIYTFLSSALLLSITQFLTQNVINLPLMWVISLGLYLVSYIVTFSSEKRYDREFWTLSFLVWLTLCTLLICTNHLAGMNAVVVVLALLFTACMICSGELILLRPAPEKLTLFYLVIAFGGALGGIFVNIIALAVFKKWWDFYLPLGMISILAIGLTINQYLSLRSKWSLAKVCFSVSSIVLMGLLLISTGMTKKIQTVAQYRNPYGFIKIDEKIFVDSKKNYRVLIHGTVMHGLQFQENLKKFWPTTYYGSESGLGYALRYLRQRYHRPLKIGIIGLGTGTIATYAKKGDYFQFYEIDPDVILAANQHFSYLKDCQGTVGITLGDARIQMQNELNDSNRMRYDLLVVDAFSGDAIPFHLMTLEAMRIYLAHLTANGIILFHTTNTYIDFLPVIKALATSQQYYFSWVESQRNPQKGIYQATWAIVSPDDGIENWLRHHQYQVNLRSIKSSKARLWTDDLNSILPLLKWQ